MPRLSTPRADPPSAPVCEPAAAGRKEASEVRATAWAACPHRTGRSSSPAESESLPSTSPSGGPNQAAPSCLLVYDLLFREDRRGEALVDPTASALKWYTLPGSAISRLGKPSCINS